MKTAQKLSRQEVSGRGTSSMLEVRLLSSRSEFCPLSQSSILLVKYHHDSSLLALMTSSPGIRLTSSGALPLKHVTTHKKSFTLLRCTRCRYIWNRTCTPRLQLLLVLMLLPGNPNSYTPHTLIHPSVLRNVDHPSALGPMFTHVCVM